MEPHCYIYIIYIHIYGGREGVGTSY
jgi:hypothetical protein